MQAVIFDCDGTLVDSEPLARRAWEQALAPYGYEVTDEDLAACLGRPYPAVHAFFAERVTIPAAEPFWTDLSGRLFALLDAELEVFPDALVTLLELSRLRVPVAVASSSPRERLERTLAKVGLSGSFPVTVAGDEVGRGKPAPDMFLTAARRLGADPAACVAVEDSVPGVRAAAAAGMVVVGVGRTVPERDALAGAHSVVDRLSARALITAAMRAGLRAA